MRKLKNKRFLEDFEDFSRWLEQRVRSGSLKKPSSVVQRSVVRSFLLQLEESGVRDYAEGYLLTKTHKDDVVRRFVNFANSKKLIGKQVITPFGAGVVLDRLVIDSSPEVFLKVKLDSEALAVIPYNLVEEV